MISPGLMMRKSPLGTFWAAQALAIALFALAAAALTPGHAGAQELEKPGEAIYRDNCSQCHGGEGDAQGHGFKAMYPRPRDFTSGLFKFRGTESGEYPLPGDMEQMISNGMPGTAMPPWKHVLTKEQISQVATYISSFYMEEDDEMPEAMEIGTAPEVTPELVTRGRKLFEKLECFRCHGNEGRGDGYNSMTLKEDWHQGPIHPRNLTAGWFFRGGHTPRDIYRTVLYGLNGTPMPAHNEEEALKKEDDRWALAHYIHSLSPSSTEPNVSSTIIAKWVEDTLPSNVDHPLWKEATVNYVPMAAQVIVEPRLYQPSVRQLWVQALYNETEIALRVRWTDATSKDNEAIREAMKKKAEDSDKALDSFPVPVDELAIQFPSKFVVGQPLPYFLMGRPGKSVNLWVWRSDNRKLISGLSSGMGRFREGKGKSGLSSEIKYKDGQYALVVKRKRITQGKGQAQFPGDPGMIPISFSAVDGFKGEGGNKRAVATWYNLYLERTVSAKVFLMPLLVILIFAGIEWWLLRSARQA